MARPMIGVTSASGQTQRLCVAEARQSTRAETWVLGTRQGARPRMTHRAVPSTSELAQIHRLSCRAVRLCFGTIQLKAIGRSANPFQGASLSSPGG